MKNPILLFLAIASIFFYSNSLVSMNINSVLNSIDLKLNEKKEYIRTHGYISTYDWCCKIADDLIKEKRLAIMKVLGVNQQELEELKKHRESQVKTIDYSDLVIKFSDEINASIINVITNKNVEKILQISGVTINNGSISAVLKNSNIPIKFLNMSQDCKNVIACSKTNSVFISPESYLKAQWWLETSSLECQIGHELAHVLFKHTIEKYCFKKIYKDNKDKISKSSFDLALKNFIISTEIQADIVGIFDNIQWAKNQWSCHHQKDMNKPESYFDDERLSLQKTANYFKEIYTYMESELEKELEPEIESEIKKEPIKKLTPQNIPKKPLAPKITKTNPEKLVLIKPAYKQQNVQPNKPVFTNSDKVSKKITDIYNKLSNSVSQNSKQVLEKNSRQETDEVNSQIKLETKTKALKNSQNYKNLIKTFAWLKNTVNTLGVKKTIGISAFLVIFLAILFN